MAGRGTVASDRSVAAPADLSARLTLLTLLTLLTRLTPLTC